MLSFSIHMNLEKFASAVIHIISLDDPPGQLNLGTVMDHSPLEIVELVAKTIGLKRRITTDPSKPNDTPRMLLNVNLLQEQGWAASIPPGKGNKRQLSSVS